MNNTLSWFSFECILSKLNCCSMIRTLSLKWRVNWDINKLLFLLPNYLQVPCPLSWQWLCWEDPSHMYSSHSSNSCSCARYLAACTALSCSQHCLVCLVPLPINSPKNNLMMVTNMRRQLSLEGNDKHPKIQVVAFSLFEVCFPFPTQSAVGGKINKVYIQRMSEKRSW